MYNLNPSFWEELYEICINPSKENLAIIDCLGPWLSPLVAAVNLGVPYFNVDANAERFQYLSTNDCASFVNVVALNASDEKIEAFRKNLKKCIKQCKEVYKNDVVGKFFIFFLKQ